MCFVKLSWDGEVKWQTEESQDKGDRKYKLARIGDMQGLTTFARHIPFAESHGSPSL